MRDFLLSDAADAATLAALRPGLTPEMVAAVSKLMRNQDLIAAARECRVVTRFRTTIGRPGRLASRLQANHPRDDPAGIAAAVLDGLLPGAGDAAIGINPASDGPDDARRLLDLLDGLRVAIGDGIGWRLGARLVCVPVGERPGLSVADSLGACLTLDPRPGRRDSERNCVSNIHDRGGLATDAAAANSPG